MANDRKTAGRRRNETGVVRAPGQDKKPSNYKVLCSTTITPRWSLSSWSRNLLMASRTRSRDAAGPQGRRGVRVFTYEVAETKVSQVIDFARENQHPLQCTLEKA